MSSKLIDPSRNITYSLKLRLNKGGTFFGPGVSDLLYYIDETRSLKTASSKMGMAYSKAWKIINIAETALGYPLVIRKVGGVDGGGSCITEDGKNLVRLFQNFQVKAYIEVDKLYEDIFEELKSLSENIPKTNI
jgi:molybdate transport system regulatory protein